MSNSNSSKQVDILSDEEQAALLIGLKSEQCDADHSLEEAIEFARQRRKKWMTSDDLSA